MEDFKVGDKVVQVRPSKWDVHNFPPEEYPTLTISKVSPSGIFFEEQEGEGFNDESRFRICAKKMGTVLTKDTNPKDAVGTKKPPMSTVSGPVLQEVGIAMLEGALKYGRHNYREAGVRVSVYYDAVWRHLIAYWEGEDIDPASGISHLSKAIAGLAVLRDSEINGNVQDDRPPRMDLTEHNERMQKLVDELLEKYPNPVPAYTEN